MAADANLADEIARVRSEKAAKAASLPAEVIPWWAADSARVRANRNRRKASRRKNPRQRMKGIQRAPQDVTSIRFKTSL